MLVWVFVKAVYNDKMMLGSFTFRCCTAAIESLLFGVSRCCMYVLFYGMSLQLLCECCRYHCYTCNMVDGIGVCSICVKVCHKDHDVSYAKNGK